MPADETTTDIGEAMGVDSVISGYRIHMSRIADVLRTIVRALATAVGAIAHAVVTVIMLPFRALAKLFRGGRKQRT